MQLFEDAQKVVSGGGKVEVSVPPCFSCQITNHTDDKIYLYPKQSSRVGWILFSGETLEIENVPETSTFYTRLLDGDTSDEKGLYILCRPHFEVIKQEIKNETNNVLIQK